MARGSEAEGGPDVREGGSICAVDNHSDVDDRASHTDGSDSDDGSEGSHDDEDADEDDAELDDSGSEAATADSAGVSGAEDGDEEHEEEDEDAAADGAPSGVEREARETNGEDDELLKALEGPITSFQPILQRFLRMGRRMPSAARICDHISLGGPEEYFERVAANLGGLMDHSDRLSDKVLRKLCKSEAALAREYFQVLRPLFQVLIHRASITCLKKILSVAARHKNAPLAGALVERIQMVSATRSKRRSSACSVQTAAAPRLALNIDLLCCLSALLCSSCRRTPAEGTRSCSTPRLSLAPPLRPRHRCPRRW